MNGFKEFILIILCSFVASMAHADGLKTYLENEFQVLKSVVQTKGLEKSAEEARRFVEILDEELLIFGQGERVITEENLHHFAEWSLRIKNEIGPINILEEYYIGARFKDLPDQPLEIIRYAIAITLKARRLKVFDYDERRSWNAPNAEKGFAYYNSFDRDLPSILKHVTLNNYSLLMTMLNAEVGECARLEPPLLYFSPILTEAMIATKTISSAQLTSILALLDDGGWRSTFDQKQRLAKDFDRCEGRQNYPFFYVTKSYHSDQEVSLETLLKSAAMDCKSALTSL